FFACSVIRRRDDENLEVLASRGNAAHTAVVDRALRERRTVTADGELATPVWIGPELWGALHVQEAPGGRLDEDDARLIETVAEQVGSAVRSAMLHHQLERAYVGTAEALGAALEPKGAPPVEHARSIVENVEAVGRILGM